MPDSRKNARARLVEARMLIFNVVLDVGSDTDLRLRLQAAVVKLDTILSSPRYLTDMPALPKEGA